MLPDEIIPYAWFGMSLTWATVGDRTFLVVGAPGSVGLELPGSAHVFEQDQTGTWNQTA